MTELSASDLVVRRGDRMVLQDVTLRAGAGEFVAVIGANGAGKSTLLAAMAGMLGADSGRIHLDARPLSGYRASELARRRAYLPQNPHCEWPISVERLVALGLTPSLPVFGGWNSSDQKKIDDVLASCDLLEHREQAATTLSGGELARAMLARAFVGDPDILIVDEPVTGLDPSHALDCIRRLKAFAQAGKLVVASLHDLTLAARYASRIVALKNGKIESDGLPECVLTASLIRKIFDTEAIVLRGAGGLYVDFIEGG